MDQKIGLQIAKLRKEQEITQTALAEYLSVSSQAVSRWENGISVPDICLLPQIAAFFSITIDELFGVTDYEKILFLVKKYSSDRNEVNYREAMRYLNMELKEDDGNLKLLALKLHMLLQRSREYHTKALALCETLIPMACGEDEELYAAFTLQRLQFYFEALLLTENTEELLAFIEKDDFAGMIFRQRDKSVLPLCDQAYRACVDLKDREGAEKYNHLMERISGKNPAD